MVQASPIYFAEGLSEGAPALRVAGEERSRAEVAREADRIGAALLRAGLRPGDRIAFITQNRPEIFPLILGAVRVGVFITPISHHLTAPEIAYIVDDSDARIVFVDEALEARVPETAERVVFGRGFADFLDGAGGVDGETMTLPVPGKAGGTMMYTSGTTGRPKGVVRATPATPAEAFAKFRAAGAAIGLDGSGAHLVTGPLYHAAPLMFALYDMLNGATVIVERRFDAARCLAQLARERVHHVHLVPTMIVRLLALGDEALRAVDLSELQLILHGAAPIAPKVKARAIDLFGPVLVEYWGATEGGVYTLAMPEDAVAKPGTVGRSRGPFEVTARDDAGAVLPPLASGTLYCRHRDLPRPFHYHGDPDKTEATFAEDGAFTAGDLGYVDRDGYVFLGDRRSNLILSGGVNIYPREVELALEEHPDIADCAVIGVPDEEWGERVLAVVEPRAEVDADTLEDSIRRHLEGRLAKFKRPRRYAFVSALPRLPTGKVRVAELRRQYRSTP